MSRPPPDCCKPRGGNPDCCKPRGGNPDCCKPRGGNPDCCQELCKSNPPPQQDCCRDVCLILVIGLVGAAIVVGSLVIAFLFFILFLLYYWPHLVMTIIGGTIAGVMVTIAIWDWELKRKIQRAKEFEKKKDEQKLSQVVRSGQTPQPIPPRKPVFGMVLASDVELARNKWSQEREDLKRKIQDLRDELVEANSKLVETAQMATQKQFIAGTVEILRTKVLFNSWSKCHMTLTSEDMLVIYKDEKMQGVEQVISLSEWSFRKNPPISGKKWCFTVSNKAVEHTFSVATEVDQEKWLQQLQETKDNKRKSETLSPKVGHAVLIDFPPEWEHPKDVFRIITLDPSSKEFIQIKDMMINSMASAHLISYKTYEIKSISRIQNPLLWRKYEFFKESLMKKYNYNPDSAGEQLLFHGTKGTIIDEIILQGFDPRVANTSGMFGAGVYFAENSSKSHQYVSNPIKETHRMLVCKVLLGRPAILTAANNSLRRPPKDLKSSNGDLFDSVIGESKKNNPKASLYHREFIVYNTEQVYCQYVIDYIPK